MKTKSRPVPSKKPAVVVLTVEAGTSVAKAADARLALAEKQAKASKARLKAAKKAFKLARKAARKAAKAAKKAHKALRLAVKRVNARKPKKTSVKRPAKKATRSRSRAPKTVDELLLAAPSPASAPDSAVPPVA